MFSIQFSAWPCFLISDRRGGGSELSLKIKFEKILWNCDLIPKEHDYFFREAGGAWGKMEAAREEEYFRRKVGGIRSKLGSNSHVYFVFTPSLYFYSWMSILHIKTESGFEGSIETYEMVDVCHCLSPAPILSPWTMNNMGFIMKQNLPNTILK